MKLGKKMEINEAQKITSEFLKERYWDQSMPSQRAAHLIREAAKLAEHTMFQEGMLIKSPKFELGKQVGDVLFSLFAFAERMGIDVEREFIDSIRGENEKYPAELTRSQSEQHLQEKAENWQPKIRARTEKVVSKND